MQEQISEIEKLNSELIAIATAGNKDDVEKTKSSLGITFTLIPMPNRKVVEKYRLRYDSYRGAYATFIIDTKGHVRFKRVETGKTRTSVLRIIKEQQIFQ